MPFIKISGLTTATAVSATNQFEINQNGGSRSATVAQVAAFARTSATDPVVLPSGTVSAPALTFTGDTNTGIYSPAADTIAFSEGGVEAMRLDASGNVGIGTTAPSERLTVNSAIGVRGSNFASLSYFGSSVNTTGVYTGLDSGGGYVINVRDAGYQAFSTNNTERMRIDASGRVGIGTASPGYRFHVVGDVYASNSVLTPGALYSDDGTTVSRVISAGGISYWGTTTSHPVVYQTNNVERMRIDTAGNVGIGTASVPFTAGYTTVAIDGATAGGAGGQLLLRHNAATSLELLGRGDAVRIITPLAVGMEFYTNNTERMRIDSAGNVGIGTSSPGAKLNVYTGSATNTFIRSQNTLAFADFGPLSDGTIYGPYSAPASGTSLIVGTSNSTPATFWTNASERMRIDTSGNVGIGTSSPGGRLDVAGFTRLGNYGGMFQGLTLQNNNDSASAETISFIDAQNNLGIADANIFFSHQTNGGSYIAFSTTPAGSRSSDRRAERARITSGGVLCIGTTETLPGYTNNTSGVALQGDGTSCFSKQGNITTVINNGGSGQALTQYNYQGNYVGQVVLNGTTGVLYQTASDYRLKQDVQPLTGGLATIAALKPSTYRWKADNSYGEGFLAHELAAHIPQAVVGEKDALNDDGSIKPQSVDYSRIVVHLVAAMQELKAENDALKARVAILENK